MPTRKYPMTVDEIVTSYRQAKNPQLQIGVLADLNVCTRKEIKDLLVEAGVLKAPLKTRAGGLLPSTRSWPGGCGARA